MAPRRTAAKKPSADGDGSADELDGLPALFVLRPYFPGEILDFEARWDHEEAAIGAADGGHGILALVPAGTDPDRLVLEAQDGYLVATLGTIVARSRDGVVRIRAEVRFQVTELCVPPDPPLANGVALDHLVGVTPELEGMAQNVRELAE